MNIRWSVRKKLIAAFGGLSIALSIVTAVSQASLADANRRFAHYVEGVAARADVASEIRTAVDRRAIAARNLVLLDQAADLQAEKAEVLRAHEDVQQGVARLAEMVGQAREEDGQDREMVAEMTRIEQAYGPVAHEIVEMALAGRRQEAIARMNKDCRPLLASLVAVAERYASHTRERAQDLVRQAEADHARSHALLLSICAAVAAAAALAAWVITRSLTRALGAEPADLGRAARQVAEGRLVTIAGADTAPRASVHASLGHMQQGLARVVGEVRDASRSIAAGSTQIASGNADLSQRTEEQASNLQQTVASMEQLTDTVRQGADTALRANRMAIQASAAAAQGGEMMGRVVVRMAGISEASRQIADIVGVIDGIAFQTNILALNAAVESARAGEQGRGFAVVAGEVRMLAMRSATAAKEIKRLIASSVERVEMGSAEVSGAGRSIDAIVVQIRQVGDLIGGVAQAAVAQNDSIAQINDAVGQLDEVTQQNAALVEQGVAAAESLKAQAARLAALVEVFELS